MIHYCKNNIDITRNDIRLPLFRVWTAADICLVSYCLQAVQLGSKCNLSKHMKFRNCDYSYYTPPLLLIPRKLRSTVLLGDAVEAGGGGGDDEAVFEWLSSDIWFCC